MVYKLLDGLSNEWYYDNIYTAIKYPLKINFILSIV
jgi:hypothetical protein